MKSKTPTLISQWTDAFLIFINIRIQKHTSEAPVLLKYPSFNREIQRLHGDTAWIAYDESFIKLRESIELAWQKAVEELRGNIFLCLRRKTMVSHLEGKQRPPKSFLLCFNQRGVKEHPMSLLPCMPNM